MCLIVRNLARRLQAQLREEAPARAAEATALAADATDRALNAEAAALAASEPADAAALQVGPGPPWGAHPVHDLAIL